MAVNPDSFIINDVMTPNLMNIIINSAALDPISNVYSQKFMDFDTEVQHTLNHVKTRQTLKFAANTKIHSCCEFVIFVQPYKLNLSTMQL